MTLNEINEATTLIQKEAHEDATVIWGMVVDKAMKEEIRVTVIATGFGKKEEKRASQFKKVVKKDQSHLAVMPPSTKISAPVTKRASSDAR